MAEIKLCPFCGSTPHFDYQGWQDERRYVQMTLECCVIMSEGIGWMRARDMTEAALKTELTASLTATWNQRYVEGDDE